MKPDEVVEILKNEWGLITTRRTVLTYEKQGLITPPYIETGKLKEYPKTVVAEFLASWGLIHGEYGLKPQKAAEIREKGLYILYGFHEIWDKEIRGIDLNNLYETPGLDIMPIWEKPCDLFIYYWLMLREGSQGYDDRVKEGIKEFIKTGNFRDILNLEITTTYLYSREKVQHHEVVSKESFFGNGSITVIFNIRNENLPPYAIVKYIHPEEFIIKRPVISNGSGE